MSDKEELLDRQLVLKRIRDATMPFYVYVLRDALGTPFDCVVIGGGCLVGGGFLIAKDLQ